MPKVYVVDVWKDASGRKRVSAIVQFAREESINPRDLGLQSVDSILASAQAIIRTQNTQPVVLGSVGAKFLTAEGTPGPLGRIRGQGPGSTITLRWTAGSSGTRTAAFHGLGTAITGTNTAHVWVVGW